MNAVAASLGIATTVLMSAPQSLSDVELAAIDFTQPDGAAAIQDAVRARDAVISALRAAIPPDVVIQFAELLRALVVDESATARLLAAAQTLSIVSDPDPLQPIASATWNGDKKALFRLHRGRHSCGRGRAS